MWALYNLNSLQRSVYAEILIVIIVIAYDAVVMHGHRHLIFRLFVIGDGRGFVIVVSSSRREEGDAYAVGRRIE